MLSFFSKTTEHFQVIIIDFLLCQFASINFHNVTHPHTWMLNGAVIKYGSQISSEIYHTMDKQGIHLTINGDTFFIDCKHPTIFFIDKQKIALVSTLSILFALIDAMLILFLLLLYINQWIHGPIPSLLCVIFWLTIPEQQFSSSVHLIVFLPTIIALINCFI